METPHFSVERTSFFGIMLVVIGLFLAFGTSAMNEQCKSGMGKVARLFDNTVQQKCSVVSVILVAGYGIAIVGSILFIIGVVSSKTEDKKIKIQWMKNLIKDWKTLKKTLKK